MDTVESAKDEFLRDLKARNPHQPAFLQVVEDTVQSIMPVYLDNDDFRHARVLDRLTEPDRTITFRVSWEDDAGNVRVNRAWRVQHSNCLGPYKGGLRFRKNVTEDTLKFLAFEQTLKNSLTGLPMGGAKGGSDFDPHDKSEREIMRFCQSLMAELYRYIGEDVDVPAGDIGVGDDEIGYLFGQYMRLKNTWTGVLTGKGCAFGGSAGRTEATGYGCVHFCQEALHRAGDDLKGKRIAISGAGTVALHAAEKAVELGADVVTLSDSSGTARFPDGLNPDLLRQLMHAKKAERCHLSAIAERNDPFEFHAGAKPWAIEADIAMPCATQNELNGDDASQLLGNGVTTICEGANMPCTPEAVTQFSDHGTLFLPGKAANAGGVAVSGMELTQNAMRLSWSRDKVDDELRRTMREIHALCVEHGRRQQRIDYAAGANIAGFIKVANAMTAYGIT